MGGVCVWSLNVLEAPAEPRSCGDLHGCSSVPVLEERNGKHNRRAADETRAIRTADCTALQTCWRPHHCCFSDPSSCMECCRLFTVHLGYLTGDGVRGGSSGAQRPCSGEARGGRGVASGADADLRARLMKRAAADRCVGPAAASGPVGGQPRSRWMSKAQQVQREMTNDVAVLVRFAPGGMQPGVPSGLAAHETLVGPTAVAAAAWQLWHADGSGGINLCVCQCEQDSLLRRWGGQHCSSL